MADLTIDETLFNTSGSFATGSTTTVSTALSTDFELSWISAHFDGIYDKEITVTINSKNGTNWDVPIYFLKQPGGTVDWFFQPTAPLVLMDGDEIDVKFQAKAAGVTCYWTIRGAQR